MCIEILRLIWKTYQKTYSIWSNITHPLDIVSRNQVIEEEHDQYNTSVTINASGEGNDDCIKNRYALSSKVKSYIDTEFNPSKKTVWFFNEWLWKVKPTDKILGFLEVSKVEYEAA